MFCSRCGKEIADESVFCNYCGARQSVPSPAPENKNGISFASTICPNCSGHLNINVKTNTAVCPYCNSRFVLNMDDSMEEAMQNAAEIETLMDDAKKFEKKCDTESALQCYKKVLELDPDHAEAKERLAKVRILNYVYLKSKMFDDYTIMELRKDSMTCHKKDGSKEIWLFRKMTDLSYFFGSMDFTYKGEISSRTIGVMDEKEVVTFIRNAQKGIYPPIDKDLLDEDE
ncbi:zinc-ribbon domain-containing protein [uncultured Succiniclasticum sp.]|uniref:zinc-ribbon domain-containing protein n=1 Tax=uncultured Succiniclasticum sp. TaxID=1500547 RepID=UPI0025F97D5C|nr:zinc-ribbon domain-containing protein [uncultured Succiniclasticum sp.]